MIFAETFSVDLSTEKMALPLLIAAGVAGVVWWFMKPKASTPMATVAGLFSGSRLTMATSILSLLMHAGSLKEFARSLLAKLNEFANANQEPVAPVEPPKVEEKK